VLLRPDFLYLCRMKDEIDIPIQNKVDFVAANLRRDNYAQTRDLQAMEFNSAIAIRHNAEANSQLKCEKCGKTFTAEINEKDILRCPDCR
jgi:hypothetical protein